MVLNLSVIDPRNKKATTLKVAALNFHPPFAGVFLTIKNIIDNNSCITPTCK
jgi:hypothetical protein